MNTLLKWLEWEEISSKRKLPIIAKIMKEMPIYKLKRTLNIFSQHDKTTEPDKTPTPARQ